MPLCTSPTRGLPLSLGLLSAIAYSTLSGPIASARTVVATFDAPPTVLIDVDDVTKYPLEDGEYNIQEDGIRNRELGEPIWNAGGWLEPIGTESQFDNLGMVGPNLEGLSPFAVLTNLFSTVAINESTSWGDVRGATHVIMDVQGSFAGSGGISVSLVSRFPDGSRSPSFWSWGAASSENAVGLNPGDVTEWTTIMIPIVYPEAGNGDAKKWGNWNNVPEADLAAGWDSAFSNVSRLLIHGLTPDSKIDNVGFLLPDVGLPGDFNADGVVDAADYTVWRDNQGSAFNLGGNGEESGTSSGVVDAADYSLWRSNYGATSGEGAASFQGTPVPEPCAGLLGAMLVGFAVRIARPAQSRRRRQGS